MRKLFSVRKVYSFSVYSSVFMITMVLPLSARAVIAFSIISLSFMPFMMYACLLCDIVMVA